MMPDERAAYEIELARARYEGARYFAEELQAGFGALAAFTPGLVNAAIRAELSAMEEEWRSGQARTLDLRAVRHFWLAVCGRAEVAMLETRTLEGSHYAAGRAILAELEQEVRR